ncbi:MAG TPA: peptidylprolyl isomerase [Terriglobia bacterium]|jgi:peptidyl-prolyl cis-trans isomerase A (cyclophilin A)
MKRYLVFLLLAIAPIAFGQEKKAAAPPNAAKLPPGVYAHFSTSLGDFTCELYEKQSPVTVANFIGLAQGTKTYTDPRTNKKTTGKPFFDGTLFHRIIDGFMIQGGDPLGTGTGGPGYEFKNENAPGLTFDKEGRLAMANAGPNTNGSQFFVTLAPVTQLNGGYTIFGQVVEGMDVVHKIGKVPVKAGGGGERSSPTTPVMLKKVTIERVK